jgi:hypothetical protein
MGTKNEPGTFDCYDVAEDDEPMFVLLARDKSAPDLVRQWAEQRARIETLERAVAKAIDWMGDADQALVDADLMLGLGYRYQQEMLEPARDGIKTALVAFGVGVQNVPCQGAAPEIIMDEGAGTET